MAPKLAEEIAKLRKEVEQVREISTIVSGVRGLDRLSAIYDILIKTGPPRFRG